MSVHVFFSLFESSSSGPEPRTHIFGESARVELAAAHSLAPGPPPPISSYLFRHRPRREEEEEQWITITTTIRTRTHTHTRRPGI